MKTAIPWTVSIVLLAAAADAAPLTTASLIEEMTDLARLAEFPGPAYETLQFSSYDHRSTLPGGKHWFANADGFGNEPVPNFEAVLREPGLLDKTGEYLVCDVKGPGAIVRVWTARIAGNIRLYLDGAEDPVYDGPAEAFFMHPYDTFLEGSGLSPDLLAGTFYQRNAAYCPIPFASRCRVVWTGNLKHTHFYQLQVRQYPPGTEVTTFKPSDLATCATQIRQASAVLADADAQWAPSQGSERHAFETKLKPGKEARLFEEKGPKAIEQLVLEVEAADRDLALRQTILHIRFDGARGQVQSPIGDFFGAAPGVNPYGSLAFSVHPGGRMVCRYVMPFKEELRIEVENLGEQPVSVRGTLQLRDYAWNGERSMHFRARWRIDHGLAASGRDPQDIPFLVANGTGTYVGSVSYVLNPNNVPSSGGNWWGEGDEKIFVDDDRRPSTFGTGSEDYYNYAWSSGDIFNYPYCGQPVNSGPANRGFVTNYRWHVLDPLPFQERIAFYMELFPHEATEGMAYGRIGYHYARPGLMDDHLRITREDVREQVLPENWQPAARGAAKNAVFFQAEEHCAGSVDYEMESDKLWAGGKLLRWKPKAAGEELAFTFPVPEKGRYNVSAAFALDKDSGRITAFVNDNKTPLAGGPIDLFRPHRTLLRVMRGPERELPEGECVLKLRYEGPSGTAETGSVGIDFIWLQKR